MLEPGHRIMLDPSVLLDPENVGWVSELAALFVVSATLRDLLAERRLQSLLPFFVPGSKPPSDDHIGRLLELMDGPLELFAAEQAREPDEAVLAVRNELLRDGPQGGAVEADQWAFLWSHSLMYSLSRRPLDAFLRAGAAVLEYGRRVLDEALQAVVPKEHLDAYAPGELAARGAIKWLVVGGAGSLAGVLGGPVGGFVSSGVLMPFVRAVDS